MRETFLTAASSQRPAVNSTAARSLNATARRRHYSRPHRWRPVVRSRAGRGLAGLGVSAVGDTALARVTMGHPKPAAVRARGGRGGAAHGGERVTSRRSRARICVDLLREFEDLVGEVEQLVVLRVLF